MRSRTRVLETIASMVAALTLGGALRAAPPADADVIAAVDAIAARSLQQPGAVGLSIGVARGGQVIVARGYGLAHAEFDVPADKDTMFRIGSVTKQFTAAAIMRLVEQGRISLGDELGTYLPDYPLHGNTVTIRHLLDHTSGIRSYTSLGEEWFRLHPLELTHEELLALVRDKPFDFSPGEKWAYNNTAYYMLGMIIETVTGRSYAQHMQEEYFTPLGLDRTRYDSNRTLMKNRAQGYTLQDGELVNDLPLGMSQPYAAGSLISTGEDLVRWSMALASGTVVTPASLALMTTATVLPDGENTRYGFGLQIDAWEGRRCIRHGGGIHGFNAMLMWLPEEDVHVAVISNGEPLKSGRVADAIGRAVLGIETAEVKDVPITPEVMKRIAGRYRLPAIGMDCTIWEDGGRAMLQASAEGQVAFPLLWQGADVRGGHEFRASFDHEVRLIFADDGRSFTLTQGGREAAATRIDE